MDLCAYFYCTSASTEKNIAVLSSGVSDESQSDIESLDLEPTVPKELCIGKKPCINANKIFLFQASESILKKGRGVFF